LYQKCLLLYIVTNNFVTHFCYAEIAGLLDFIFWYKLL